MTSDALVLIHAFPLDASMWEPQIREFEPELRVVAPHLPGFGGAPGAGEILEMADAAEAVDAAIRDAGVDRAVVGGLSMGGYVAFEYWRRHAERVAGMVLANTRAGVDDEAGRERRRALAARLRAEGNVLADEPPPLLSSTVPESLWAKVKEIIRAQPAESIAAASLGMAERVDSTQDLARIDVPVLVVTSTGDTLIPPEASSPMADVAPDGHLAVLDGPGHLSNLEAPEEFNLALRSHLVRCGLLGA